MLILTRKIGEIVRIGDNVTVRVLGLRGGQVSLGFTAPSDVRIFREEVLQADRVAAAAAAADGDGDAAAQEQKRPVERATDSAGRDAAQGAKGAIKSREHGAGLRPSVTRTV